MSNRAFNEAAKAVVRRNTEVGQGKGNFHAFKDPFANDCVDHSPQSDTVPDKPDTRGHDQALRKAFPDFYAVIHWQTAWTVLGRAPTGLNIYVEAADSLRVHNWKITEHWGVANLFSLVQQFAHSHWRHEADRWLIIPTAKISFGD